MSKLECQCGNIISDDIYPSPSEGMIIREQDENFVFEGIAKSVAEFINAVAIGKREEWIEGFFKKGYPKDLDDRSVVSDIISSYVVQRGISVTECDRCGKLFIQEQPGSNYYNPYSPDLGKGDAILKTPFND